MSLARFRHLESLSTARNDRADDVRGRVLPTRLGSGFQTACLGVDPRSKPFAP